jgi:hypothetical protein
MPSPQIGWEQPDLDVVEWGDAGAYEDMPAVSVYETHPHQHVEMGGSA